MLPDQLDSESSNDKIPIPKYDYLNQIKYFTKFSAVNKNSN